MSFKRPIAIFVMGVSGVGKSTIGKLLAEAFDIPFFDGDDYHPEENIAKMKSGKALNDSDRLPWLSALNKLAKDQIQSNSCVIACSALKQDYRSILRKEIQEQVKLVFLYGDAHLITQRLERPGHFMPSSLLQSQLETLEKPNDAICIDIVLSPGEIIDKIKDELTEKSEFGLIGLGVMGTSLARNLASNNFDISIYNRHVSGQEEDVAILAVNHYHELARAKPFDDLSAFVNSLQKPRKILLMVNAGKAIDAVVDSLIPLLDENDVIIDGGNSHYEDTKRRISFLRSKNIDFIGAGISGGEEGALHGPSIMPSGSKKAYGAVQPFLEKIAAKDAQLNPCCTYIGPEGSGHFVKMVHNGIEYVEMQLLAELYAILRSSNRSNHNIAELLESWKKNDTGFLLEITIDILRKKDDEGWLIDTILDKSGNKGTGNWTTVAAAQLGMPSTMVASALFARYISSFKEERLNISEQYTSSNTKMQNIDVQELFSAYQFARLINHIQGFELIHEASVNHNWHLNLSEIARIWTNGCIIRSDLMQKFITYLKGNENLFLIPAIKLALMNHFPSTKKVIANCIDSEIAIPCFTDAINYFNAFKTAVSPANLIQAQRDYFGAHTYKKMNDPSGESYHTNWKNEKIND